MRDTATAAHRALGRAAPAGRALERTTPATGAAAAEALGGATPATGSWAGAASGGASLATGAAAVGTLGGATPATGAAASGTLGGATDVTGAALVGALGGVAPSTGAATAGALGRIAPALRAAAAGALGGAPAAASLRVPSGGELGCGPEPSSEGPLGAGQRRPEGAELGGGGRATEVGIRAAAADSFATTQGRPAGDRSAAGPQPALRGRACPPGVPPRVWHVDDQTRRHWVLAAEAAAAAAARERARILAAERAEAGVAASCVAADAESAGESWAPEAEEVALACRWPLQGAAQPVAYALTDSTNTTSSERDGADDTWWTRLGTASPEAAGGARGAGRDLGDPPVGPDCPAASPPPGAVTVGTGDDANGGAVGAAAAAPAVAAPPPLVGTAGGAPYLPLFSPDRGASAASAGATPSL